MLNRILALLGAFVVAGCGSTPLAQLPSEVESGSKVRLKLETKSQILVIHKLAAGARCENAKEWQRISVRSASTGDTAKLEASCTLVAKAAAVRTKEYLAAGDYDVKIETSMNRSRFLGTPLVTVNPQDPDAKSGPDQDFGGAVELAENQTVKGAVSHAEANGTNWITIKPKGEVSLFLLSETPGDLQANLLHLPKGARNPHRLGVLTAKTKRHVRVTDGVLYVQVTAKKFTAASSYTITRRDMPSGKPAVEIPVIDCYPVNASSSVVLLKASDALKVNDELRISAKQRNGSNITVGKCTVTSVSESQASCRMESVPAPNLSKYRAQIVKEESST